MRRHDWIPRDIYIYTPSQKDGTSKSAPYATFSCGAAYERASDRIDGTL